MVASSVPPLPSSSPSYDASTAPVVIAEPTPTPQSVPQSPPTPVIEWVENTLGGGDLPLAARLLDTLLHLLFLPHFTVSASPPSMQQIQAYQQSEDGNMAHAQLPFYCIQSFFNKFQMIIFIDKFKSLLGCRSRSRDSDSHTCHKHWRYYPLGQSY